MDPISILTLTGTCVKLVSSFAGVVMQVDSIVKAYRDVPRDIVLLRSQVSTTKTSLDKLRRLLESNHPCFQGEMDMETLEISLDACGIVVSDIQVHVTAVSQEVSGFRRKAWKRIQHLWDADAMKENERRLGLQLQSLSVLLTVCSLESEGQR
ncbi:uncharacterized protein LY89DRAFT_379009 [Mollisia scopiformis]|uniref:Fungal N-terminal domain-containing protein n=1 Tax=Mollisia scopiformis TaxID=149040 RepID=A0A194XMX5_MOLSC|nr:uncharacterized protein LY89DRAFT_379009 [Mollisia scopiformis]KUJ21615.1 hypothetical protein LY89DRAFT_379009 [Mollisia scopiformis]